MSEKKNVLFAQNLAAFIATISAFSTGLSLSWTSSALPMLTTHQNKIHINKEEASWITSLLPLGAIISSLVANKIANKIGPRRTLQFSAFPFFTSWVFIAYCSTVYGLYVARFLAGLAIGAILIIAPRYLNEISDEKSKTCLGHMFKIQIAIGILCGYILGGYIKNFIILAHISALPSILYLMLLSFMPESPYHLACKESISQAESSLRWFRRRQLVNEEMSKITNYLRNSENLRGWTSLWSLMYQKEIYILLSLSGCVQFTGISALIFYTEDIFNMSLVTLDPTYSTILLGSKLVFCTLISQIFINRFNRKPLLFVSLISTSLALIFIGYHLHFQTLLPLEDYFLLVSLSICINFFCISNGPLPWSILTDIYQSEIGSMAITILATFNWFLVFLISKYFYAIVELYSLGILFLIFGITSTLAVLFVVIFLPETRIRIEEVHERDPPTDEDSIKINL